MQILTRIKNTSWSPPADNYLKINIDASFDDTVKKFGIGLIIRDSAGNSRGIRGKYFNEGIDAEQDECFAINEALNWGNNLHFDRILLESDCQNVFFSINDATLYVHWVNQGLVNEIKHQLSTRSGTTLIYLNRSGNNVAHVIANRARNLRASFNILDDIPADMYKALRDDVVNLKLCT
ncbi:uncharacterized protein LOC113315289 [Papaver somniferum]|uniref:uncharacterized protein LOC113315289 n=1 Tax=Papaver somniferum TaxID=3469 RepID=UPI000E6FBC4F|nr:uncharacterized protein LOC113315289 [Papaver somniferum]